MAAAVRRNKLLGRAAAFALLPGLLIAGAIAASPLAAPTLPRHPPIAAAEWQPQAGDVILLAADDLIGSRIRSASGNGAIYAHVGVVVTRGGVPHVAEVTPFGSGRVDFTDLAAFTTDGKTTDLLVLRPHAPIDAGRLTAEAERLAAAGIEFDYAFDMNDGSELYCAELAYRLLAAAGHDVSSVPWTEMYLPLHGDRNLVAPDAFAHAATLRPVFRRQLPQTKPQA
jgi:hypothetical protein